MTDTRMTEVKPVFDMISHPSHYAEGRKYEPVKVIRDWDLSFNLGNAVKYISRVGRKGSAIEDLEKARQYIQFEIDALIEEANEILDSAMPYPGDQKE